MGKPGSASLPELLAVEPDFLVVTKPPDLLSHPTRPDGRPTLLGWLQEKFPGEFVALVNRLDRETSGTVLAARSPEAASRLGALTMRREIHKYYLALVSGRVEAEHGVIDAPIGRLGVSEENPIWLRRGVIAPDDPLGRKSAEARTEFWRLAVSKAGEANPISLLRLQAHTGRLHQLRVHLAYIGHPVIGDKIYGPDSKLYLKFIAEGWTEEHQRVLGLPRHALHAHELRFPWNGEERAFTAPLPEDMRQFGKDLLSPEIG
ncbi:MAG: RluA family pseudouridine synthase [Methylacidiphilales bacterium]|nr:RluA family pseudouridine synthase [Candidatus Methylacidiphilales bacterium]